MRNREKKKLFPEDSSGEGPAFFIRVEIADNDCVAIMFEGIGQRIGEKKNGMSWTQRAPVCREQV
ncbi:hypothetical protein GTO89_10300 [Heliobacterium gestii]|uniref:Uncharacterized protein n=1 Tax=Heliomicrobium gestii TaxID=2699 RepID=A0A845LET9_HELGE|nr:hypothetical protein [Heliomicrobium gestii]MBM7867157.1 hypothetical protein [Heliomicrobium gestii]MZP43430.1 hypothetical protein [Heliomicrobium gestii]